MEIAINTSDAKEIICFNDGRMDPKNEFKEYIFMKKVFIAFLIILIGGSVLFKEFLFSGESLLIWLCFFIVL